MNYSNDCDVLHSQIFIDTETLNYAYIFRWLDRQTVDL